MFGCECVRFATAMHNNKYQGRLAVAKLPLIQNSIIKIENGTKKYLFLSENIENFNYLRRSLSSSLVIWWPLKISMVCRRHWKFTKNYRKDHHYSIFLAVCPFLLMIFLRTIGQMIVLMDDQADRVDWADHV